MKAYQRITLFATVLAAAALPPLLRAQSNEPATPLEPVESPAADMQEIERKALRKQYDLALKELVAAEEAMLKVASPEPEFLILEQAYLKRAEWLEQVKDQLVAIDHVQNPKLAALTKKLKGVIPGPVAFEDKPIDEVLQFVERIIKQDDQIGSGLVVNVVLIDKDNQSPVTMSLENVTLHTVLKVAAQQADLTIHIEDEIISLRKFEHTKEEIAASLALWGGHKPEVGDLTYVLHRIRYPKIDYQDVSVQAMLDDVEYHLSSSRDARPDLQVPKFSFRGGEESKSTFSIKLGNATLYTVLNVVAEQAGLRLDIGKELISMRKPTGKQAVPASKTVWPVNHPKVTALTKKLDAIRIPEAIFEDATINELVEFLRTGGKELDPDKTGVNLALMDEDNKSTVTFHLENATMHTILKIAAEQAGLALHIGEDVVSLRKPTGKPAAPASNAVLPDNHPKVTEADPLSPQFRSPLQRTPEKANSYQMTPATASKATPFLSGLGLEFVPAGTRRVLFCRTETRVRDFRAFASETANAAFASTQKNMEGHTLEKKEEDGHEWKLAGATWEDPHFKQGADHPVVCVSLTDAQAFAAWLTVEERAKGLIGPEDRYRLPTDDEWSAACGLGKYPWGSAWPPPADAGNFCGPESRTGPAKVASWGVIEGFKDAYDRTAPVAQFAENEFGLYDMGGNVWEMCSSEYRPTMNSTEVRNQFPFLEEEKSEDGTAYRVLRGGSWGDCVSAYLLSSYRFYIHPAWRYQFSGFRLVLEVGSGG